MIYKADPSDLNAILELENEAFKDPWTYENFIASLENDFIHLYKLIVADKIIGYVLFMLVFERMEIFKIAIKQEFRRQAYASELLNFIFDNFSFKDCNLEVRASNLAAIKLYQKLGFKVNRIRPKYYNDEDAYEMIRSNNENTCVRN